MLQFGLRLGARPRQLVTTTPRPVPLLKALMADPETALTKISTDANRANLAPGFIEALAHRYGGSRLGRQELDGELIEDDPDAVLSAVERASFEREARIFADAQGYAVDWESVTRLDDMALINGVSQIVPFDIAAKQALLEAPDLAARCELLVQLLQFFGRRDSDDNQVTLQ